MTSTETSMDQIKAHYTEMRVLIILVLAITLLGGVFGLGRMTTQLDTSARERSEHAARIAILERDVDKLTSAVERLEAANRQASLAERLNRAQSTP